MIAMRLLTFPVSKQFSSSIARGGEYFQRYLRAAQVAFVRVILKLT